MNIFESMQIMKFWDQMDNTDLGALLITAVLIALMFFIFKGIPKLFPMSMKKFRDFYFGKGYLNDKQKIAKMKRILKAYARIDLWDDGGGRPFVDNKPYGHGQEGDGIFYNMFKLQPAQDGWVPAEDVLREIEAADG